MTNDKQKERYKRIAMYGLGAGLATAAGLTLAKKGVRAHLRAKLKGMQSGSADQAASAMNMASTEVPQFARNHANDIMSALRRRGYKPQDLSKMKIGLVGTGGTGKSSLALALTEKADLRHLNVDSYISTRLGSMGNVDVARAMNKPGVTKPGTIVDQVQILHGAEVGNFDMIIKVKRDAADIVDDLYNRGHYGFVADYTDIRKAQKLVDDAFDLSGGSRLKVNDNIELTLNPHTDVAKAERILRAEALGFNLRKFKSLNQRDQLISISEGKLVKGKSWRATISKGKLERDTAITGAVILGGAYYGSRDKA